MFKLKWLGLPDYPGIVLFFVSVMLSHHVFEILAQQDYEDLAGESLEAVLLGLVAAGVCIALVRYLSAPDQHTLLWRLSVTLLPGVLFVLAPFRYAQVCRWTGWCQYWSDTFLLLGAALSILVCLYLWHKDARRLAQDRAREVGGVIARMSPLHLFLVAWFLCTALLVWRGHERLLHPELFAEGGRVFMADALNRGWHSLATAYDGFYHTAPRLIALLVASTAPVAWIPAATTALCFLIAGAASAFIVRPAFRWLVPSDAARIAAAILLCLVPGLRETLGNLPNLHYLLIIVLALLLLKDPGEPYRLWELVVAALIVASSGMVAALVPAAGARLWLTLSRQRPGTSRTHPRGNRAEIAFASIIVVPTVGLALVLLVGGPPGSGDDMTRLTELNVITILKACGTVFTGLFLLHPFSGPVAATEIMLVVPQATLVPLSIIVFSTLFRLLVVDGHRFPALLAGAWLSAPLALIALLAYTRDPDLGMFLLEADWQWYKWWMRYNYLFAVFGIILWLLLLRPTHMLPRRRAANVLFLTLCAAYASQANWYFTVHEYGDERRWMQTAPELERSIRTGCPRSVEVRIYPGDWRFTYSARKDNDSCDPSRSQP